MKKVVAFIPARGGSKEVPNKNIKFLAGKPLIAWSIEQALASELVDEVYVSTDSEEIASISRAYGAKTPFMRPLSLSGDTASTESAMKHFCEYLKAVGASYSHILLLQATSPIRARGRLDEAIKFFWGANADSLLSVAASHRFFWTKSPDVRALYDFEQRPRRQDVLEEDRRYMETGSFYLCGIDGFLESNNRLFGKIELYETPEGESLEIDSLLDFKLCEVALTEQMG